MKRESMDITTLWAELAVEELVRLGVTTFIISPGSRSTPLALAVARNERAGIITHFDERGAAYVAVGYARAARRPAALICTSGTAVANYLPAVVEASMDHLPMIVLSADRPPELHDIGANQTIDQQGIFGEFVRWECTIPCATAQIPVDFVLSTIDEAVNRMEGTDRGPVHLNVQLREPLTPTNNAVLGSYVKALEKWENETRPYTALTPTSVNGRDDDLNAVAPVIAKANSGLLVVGRLPQDGAVRAAIVSLANKLKWPATTDIGSGFRLGNGLLDQRLPYADLMLLGGADLSAVDCIVQIGGPLVSKRLTEYLALHRGEYIVINEHSQRRDVGPNVTRRVHADIASFVSQLAAAVPSLPTSLLFDKLQDQTVRIDDVLEREAAGAELCEPMIARTISKLAPRDHALFLASSLTVRDFDMFASTIGNHVPVGCNRGASGIDGTVGSAVGFARGLNRPTTLVIGDTALLHDLNSLAFVKSAGKPPVTIVVINNGGGAIFGMLPIAEMSDVVPPDTVRKLFVQEHRVTFRAAAELFGLRYDNPIDAKSFVDTYTASATSGESCLIEVRFHWQTSRSARLALHEKVKSVIAKR